MKMTPRKLIELLHEIDDMLLDTEIKFYGCDGMCQYFDSIDINVHEKEVQILLTLDGHES